MNSIDSILSETDVVYTTIRQSIERMIKEKAFPRSFSMYSIQKVLNVPKTAEGLALAKKKTTAALMQLQKEGIISEYHYTTRWENGPEYVLVSIPKSKKKKASDNDVSGITE